LFIFFVLFLRTQKFVIHELRAVFSKWENVVSPDKILSGSYIQKHLCSPPLYTNWVLITQQLGLRENIKIFSPTMTGLPELYPVVKIV
jgi:hypothetical protein